MAVSLPDAGSIPLIELFLQRLRAAIPAESSSDIDDPAERPRCGAEHVLAAHLLGAALAPHFQSLDQLAATTDFIAITARTTEDAWLFASVLKAALPDSGAVIEPQYRLRTDDKYPIFVGSGSKIDERLRMAAEPGDVACRWFGSTILRLARLPSSPQSRMSFWTHPG